MSTIEPPRTVPVLVSAEAQSPGPPSWARMNRATPPPRPPRRDPPSSSSISSPTSRDGEDARDVDDLLEGIDRVRIDDLWSTPLSARASPSRNDVPTPVAPARNLYQNCYVDDPARLRNSNPASRMPVNPLEAGNACAATAAAAAARGAAAAAAAGNHSILGSMHLSFQAGLFPPPRNTGIASKPMAHAYAPGNAILDAYHQSMSMVRHHQHGQTNVLADLTNYDHNFAENNNPTKDNNRMETCVTVPQRGKEISSHRESPCTVSNQSSRTQLSRMEHLQLSLNDVDPRHPTTHLHRSAGRLQNDSSDPSLLEWAGTLPCARTTMCDSVETSSETSPTSSPHDMYSNFSVSRAASSSSCDIASVFSNESSNLRDSGRDLTNDEKEFPTHFKMFPCPRPAVCAASGNIPECFYYHPNSEDRRRGNCMLYKPHMCRFVEEAGGCRKGDRCPFSHNDFERRYHPDRFGKETCRDFLRGDCPRKYCTFRHEVSGNVELAISQIDSMNDKELLQLVLKISENQGRALSDKLMRRFGHSKKHSGWRLEGFNPQGRDDQKVKYVSVRVDGLKKLLRVAGEKKWAATLKTSSLRDMMSGCRKVAEEIRERYRDDQLRKDGGNEMHRLIRAVFSSTNWSCHSQEGDNPFLVTPENQNDAVTALERLIEIIVHANASHQTLLSSISSTSSSSLPSSTTSSPPLTTLAAPVTSGNASVSNRADRTLLPSQLQLERMAAHVPHPQAVENLTGFLDESRCLVSTCDPVECASRIASQDVSLQPSLWSLAENH